MLQKELCRRLQYFTLSGFDSGKSINFAAEIKGKASPLPLPRRGDSENRDVILSETKDPAMGPGQSHCEILHYVQNDKAKLLIPNS